MKNYLCTSPYNRAFLTLPKNAENEKIAIENDTSPLLFGLGVTLGGFRFRRFIILSGFSGALTAFAAQSLYGKHRILPIFEFQFFDWSKIPGFFGHQIVSVSGNKSTFCRAYL